MKVTIYQSGQCNSARSIESKRAPVGEFPCIANGADAALFKKNLRIFCQLSRSRIEDPDVADEKRFMLAVVLSDKHLKPGVCWV